MGSGSTGEDVRWPFAGPSEVREVLRQRLAERRPRRLPRELVPSGFRAAAVLVALFPDDDAVRMILTHRSDALPAHGGEISFPGGRQEPGEAALAAALRESEEEVGLEVSRVEVLGELDEVWSIGGYVVRPFVGWVEGRPTLVPDAGEIQAILLPRLRDLAAPGCHRRSHIEAGGARFPVHHYTLGEAVVWGLTGGLVHRLLGLLGGGPVEEANDARALRAYAASLRAEEEKR